MGRPKPSQFLPQKQAEAQKKHSRADDESSAADRPKARSAHYTGSQDSLMAHDIKEVIREVRAGNVPIRVSPEQITDDVGTDRQAGWDSDNEFKDLKANIQSYGQQQPIRLRALNPGWAPKTDQALRAQPTDRFALQSGRRRLEACKQLGIDVYAFISTDMSSYATEDASLEDLQERFYENTLHKRLTALDRLKSIGEIGQRMRKVAEDEGRTTTPTQSEIARRIGAGVSQPVVSVGLDVVKHYEELLARLGESATFDQIRDLIPQLDGEDEERPAPQVEDGGTTDTSKQSRAPTNTGSNSDKRSYRVGGGASLRQVRGGRGLTLKVNRGKLDDSKWRRLEKELEKVIRKFEDKGPE